MERALFIDYVKFSFMGFETEQSYFEAEASSFKEQWRNVETRTFTECMVDLYFKRSDINDFITKEELKNIRYKPNLNCKSTLELKGSTHDGTLLFVEENCLTALNVLYNYYYDNKDKLGCIEFGDIEIKSDHGTKDINGMNIQGQTDVVKIPVNIKFKEE